jgi:hypothetical protein
MYVFTVQILTAWQGPILPTVHQQVLNMGCSIAIVRLHPVAETVNV